MGVTSYIDIYGQLWLNSMFNPSLLYFLKAR